VSSARPAVLRDAVAVRSPAAAHVGIGQIFLAFLLIGATSFGGGVVAHLRNSLVATHRWIDDATFLKLLGISQSLPGLNTTNLAILAGNRLRGARGALAAILGICLPGATLLYIVGIVYQVERERPLVEAGLEGVAAAAAGLILATTVQLARKSLSRVADLVFVALTVTCVNRLHISVPSVLIIVGALAVVWYVAGPAKRAEP
jgi:chromate transporter